MKMQAVEEIDKKGEFQEFVARVRRRFLAGPIVTDDLWFAGTANTVAKSCLAEINATESRQMVRNIRPGARLTHPIEMASAEKEAGDAILTLVITTALRDLWDESERRTHEASRLAQESREALTV
jgi:hypothetical protein